MDELETYFGWVQTMASTLVCCIVKRRITRDDRRSIIYYCELLAEKMKQEST